MFDPGRPIFEQVAENIEESIVAGALAEEARAPSTNELASFYRINPATAAKGVALLTDRGIVIKRRGLGMFVAPGARAILIAERRERFATRFIEPLLAEAGRLGMSTSEAIDAVRTHTAGGTHTTGHRSQGDQSPSPAQEHHTQQDLVPPTRAHDQERQMP
jgi:DNA-binding transcriptional regulator YhcF (GntR family)